MNMLQDNYEHVLRPIRTCCKTITKMFKRQLLTWWKTIANILKMTITNIFKDNDEYAVRHNNAPVVRQIMHLY